MILHFLIREHWRFHRRRGFFCSFWLLCLGQDNGHKDVLWSSGPVTLRERMAPQWHCSLIPNTTQPAGEYWAPLHATCCCQSPFSHLHFRELLPAGLINMAQCWLGQTSQLLCYLVGWTTPSPRRSGLQPGGGALLNNLSFLRYSSSCLDIL